MFQTGKAYFAQQLVAVDSGRQGFFLLRPWCQETALVAAVHVCAELAGVLSKHGCEGTRVEYHSHGRDLAVLHLVPFGNKGCAHRFGLQVAKEAYVIAVFEDFQNVHAIHNRREFLNRIQIIVGFVECVDRSAEF